MFYYYFKQSVGHFGGVFRRGGDKFELVTDL